MHRSTNNNLRNKSNNLLYFTHEHLQTCTHLRDDEGGQASLAWQVRFQDKHERHCQKA